MLATPCSRAEAADRNELVSTDPNAPSLKTNGIQKPAGPKSGALAVQAIPLEEVPDRAEATRAELNTLLPTEASRQMLKRIGSEIDRALPEVESRLAKTRKVLAGRPNVRTLQELEAGLSGMRERLKPVDKELDRQLTGLRT
ncbi:MAG: hypothetical protein KJP23_22745, partial [Deltaproteobacteria bacterium]|nr:hypothetical protein [Deltaproteobacteria bacterium]